MNAVAPEKTVESPAAVGPWEPARHPKMSGFFCLSRARGGKTEHHTVDDSVAMFWSRGEAVAVAQNLPKA